jgi:hypothetical protein
MIESMRDCPFADLSRAVKCEYGVVYGCSRDEIKEI